MANEFEDQYNVDDFNDDNEDNVSEKSVSEETPNEKDELVDSTPVGQEYDVSKAPKTAKGPERVLMDGKEITVTSMSLILPPEHSAWSLSKDKKTKYKNCIFSLSYDNDGQKEYYSGVRVFDRTKNNIVKYSDPAIKNTTSTQAGYLKNVYARYKGKSVDEVSLFEFLSFLKSKPRALLKVKEYKFYNDKTGEETITQKNIIEKFI